MNKAILQAKEYLQVYRLHLQNNDLEDDSNNISLSELIDYVNNHISDSDKAWYGLTVKV